MLLRFLFKQASLTALEIVHKFISSVLYGGLDSVLNVVIGLRRYIQSHLVIRRIFAQISLAVFEHAACCLAHEALGLARLHRGSVGFLAIAKDDILRANRNLWWLLLGL